MQTGESSAKVIGLLPNLLKKSKIREELGAEDLDTALDKSLNMAHSVAETLDDPVSNLLVERKGRYQELKGFA